MPSNEPDNSRQERPAELTMAHDGDASRSGPLPAARDRLLFTPGPLTTSAAVKQAMLRDLGSRDGEFIALVRRIRQDLLGLARVSSPAYEAVLLQGSGTFALEACLATFRRGASPAAPARWLVAVNGAYGRRFADIGARLGVHCQALVFDEDQPVDPGAVERALAADPSLSHVSVVHCETTTGILNPVEEVAQICGRLGRLLLVDAMSSFGAVPLDLGRTGIDLLVSSANKCIEGVPGFSFVIARRQELQAASGLASSVCLDLSAQWQGLERDGQFRFTPPTHALLAFGQALAELEQEGGVAGRAARYRENQRVLVQGMQSMGFSLYLRPHLQSPVITTFRYPRHPGFVFESFYRLLARRGYVIYPGKVGSADCFRVGSIGRIFPAQVQDLLAAVSGALEELGISPGALDGGVPA